MRKYFYILILGLFIFNINVNALENEQKINPEWLNYMKLSDEEKTKVIMPMMCKTYSNVSSSLKDDSTIYNMDIKIDIQKNATAYR